LSDGYKKLYTAAGETSGSSIIKDKIRQRIKFSQCDLTEDFQSIGKMDLIICPEVLVYFSNGVKAGILKQFSSLLNTGGIFLTANNQVVTPFTDSFERVDHTAGVFYRQKK
jgi:chemotaxis protein methyltransferase CheR